MSVQKMTFELLWFQRLIVTLITRQQFGPVLVIRVLFQILSAVRGEGTLLALVGLVLPHNFKQLLLI